MSTRFTQARLLTVNEVADLLRVSRMTVYRLIKEGQLKALRVGRSYRLREDDVDPALESPQDLTGVVGRAVVDDDHVDVRIGLVAGTAQRLRGHG